MSVYTVVCQSAHALYTVYSEFTALRIRRSALTALLCVVLIPHTPPSPGIRRTASSSHQYIQTVQYIRRDDRTHKSPSTYPPTHTCAHMIDVRPSPRRRRWPEMRPPPLECTPYYPSPCKVHMAIGDMSSVRAGGAGILFRLCVCGGTMSEVEGCLGCVLGR